MSGGETDQGHDQTELLLQPCLSRLQRLGQPLAHGAKSKQSKTKLFHGFPFAMVVSHHQTSGGRSSICLSLMGEIPLSCHNRGGSTSHPPHRYQTCGSFFIGEAVGEPPYPAHHTCVGIRVLGTFCPPLGVLLLQKEERRDDLRGYTHRTRGLWRPGGVPAPLGGPARAGGGYNAGSLSAGLAWTPALQEGLSVPPLADAHPLSPCARCDGKARNIPATAFPGRGVGVRSSNEPGAARAREENLSRSNHSNRDFEQEEHGVLKSAQE